LAKIAISGMGIVSSIGMNVEENFNSLVQKRHGISRLEHIESKLNNSIFVGEIKLSNKELEAQLGLDQAHNFSRTAMLGAIAAQQALKSAELTTEGDQLLGFVNSTSVGGMDMTERFFYEFLISDEYQRFIELQNTGVNSKNISDFLGICGISTTISTACSSAANAIILGARLIDSGRLERVLVGGTDALCKFTINGFNTLMILSDDLNAPFDNNRKGLNLGEGAAYLVLESEKSLQNRGKQAIAYLSGYANTNDAFHQTASSEAGDGAYLAMQNALKKAELTPMQIDYVNVHGTATPNNDLSEGRALIRIFGDCVPDFSSTKAFTGHTLAAAASIEAVFSILALQNQVIFPNLNFREKMIEFDLVPVTATQDAKLYHVLSNSFGFGGNCSSLIFSKHGE
jgi:3-oxoacyl-(acyl-carrier-protein) synthase